MATAISPERLVGILRSHGAAFTPAAVEAALRDADLRAWATLHLTDDTLLSPDELELYEALQRSSGQAETFVADAAVDSSAAPMVVLDDATLRAATEALSHATEALTKQTDTLRHQQAATARLAQSAAEARAVRSAFAVKCRQQQQTQRDRLAVGVEQLCGQLGVRVADLEQQGRAAEGFAQQMADGLCRSDDKLLASLQKLGWVLTATDDPDEQQAVGQLRDICVQLIQHTVECIRTKLDRIYLEALEAAAAAAAAASASGRRQREARKGGSGGEAGAAALQDELESLYAEILPVAQMSVDQQYLEPALKSLAAKNGRNTARSLLALDYINACLDFLLEQITLLSARIETSMAHQAATNALLATARTELASPVSTAHRKQDEPRPYDANGSPIRRVQTGYGYGSGPNQMMSPVRHRRRSSGLGGGLGADIPPFEQQLLNLSVTLPDDELEPDAAPTPAVTRANARALQTTLTDRRAKAEDVADNVQTSFEGGIAAQLADGRRAVWMARESVLAESTFGEVQLQDPEIEGSIAVLMQEVDKIRQRLDDVGKDLDMARKGSSKREQLVARWG